MFSPTKFANCTITVFRTEFVGGSSSQVFGPVPAFLAPPIRNALPTSPFTPNDKNVERKETSTHRFFIDYPDTNSTYVPKSGDTIVASATPNAQNDGVYTVFEIPRPGVSGFASLISSFWELRCRSNAPERANESNTPQTGDDAGTVYYS